MFRCVSTVVVLLLLNITLNSQTNLKAWYANGQVWIVFNLDLDTPVKKADPRTYSLYVSESPFLSTSQAEIKARLFLEELMPTALREQLNRPEFTFSVPDVNGGSYVLAENEGVFVLTVHGDSERYYGVIKEDGTTFEAGINRTASPVQQKFSLTDPPRAYPQLSQTNGSGQLTTAYYLWVDGRQDWWNSRPDFPVMANQFKNGMPSMFILSEGSQIKATDNALMHWFHGSSASAIHLLPQSQRSINIAPKHGYLVAHNDDFYRYVDGRMLTSNSHSNFFGWSKNRNPYDINWVAPSVNDTVINYTQKKVLWVNDWLIHQLPVNPSRVSLQGHGMGASGVAALARAFPEKFATATLFNDGLTFGSEETTNQRIDLMGQARENLPTNLLDYNNQRIRIKTLWEVSSPISKSRDMCIMKLWNGKNDTHESTEWDKEVIDQIKRADASGMGWQIFWDERPHEIFRLNSHWSKGISPEEQTQYDDVSFQEDFLANQSFPAFYMHQNDTRNKNPGTGNSGLVPGDGDDWGTWGGYHRWDPHSVMDFENQWQATIWLTGDAAYKNDICPFAALTADVAIRKPQLFKPEPGSKVIYELIDARLQTLEEQGIAVVDENGLVYIPGLTIFREDIQKTILRLTDLSVSTRANSQLENDILCYPNPAKSFVNIKNLPQSGSPINIQVRNTVGQIVTSQVFENPGPEVQINLPEGLSGIYLLSIRGGNLDTPLVQKVIIR